MKIEISNNVFRAERDILHSTSLWYEEMGPIQILLNTRIMGPIQINTQLNGPKRARNQNVSFLYPACLRNPNFKISTFKFPLYQA